MFSLWAVEVSQAYSPKIMIQCCCLLFDQDGFSLLPLIIAVLRSYAFLLVLPKTISILRIFFRRAAKKICYINQRNHAAKPTFVKVTKEQTLA